MQIDGRQQGHVALERDAGVDPGGGRIHDGHPGAHVRVEQPRVVAAVRGGELHSVVHPGGLVVCGDHGAHRLPLAHQDGHDVRQVLLALGIVRGELAECVA